MDSTGTGANDAPQGSHALAEIVTAIAAARGLDLTKVGSKTIVANEPYSTLTIAVVGQNLVLLAHYQALDGKQMADPEMIFYTGMGAQLGYVPTRFRSDFTGRHGVACRVAHGQLTRVKP